MGLVASCVVTSPRRGSLPSVSERWPSGAGGLDWSRELAYVMDLRGLARSMNVAGGPRPPSLSIVMPVYNEGAAN
jgi:hypothetical protein